MTGTTRTSADLDPRRRRILMRAWRRGIREMDLVFGGFSDLYLSDLSDGELDQFEALMIENDIDLLSWITGAAPVPDTHDTALFRKIIAFEGVPNLFPILDEIKVD